MDINDVISRIEISSVGAKGDGLSGDVAVAFTLPGDVIEAGKLLRASEHRVEPVCTYFGTCGGCAMQHASDEFTLGWKRGIVEQALLSQGLEPVIRHVHQSPPNSRTRAVLSGRRTKKTVILGFHARRSDDIIAIETCDVLRPEIIEALPKLREIVRLAATRTSVVKLGVTVSDAGLDVDVRDARALDASGIEALAGIASDFARVGWNGEVVLMKSPPTRKMGPGIVTPPVGSFLQATQDGEAKLVDSVKEATIGASKIVELFAGCGTLSLPLVEAADVHAVEFDAEMLASLDEAWRMSRGVKQLTTEVRDLFRRPVLESEFKGADAVVLDPPRAGAAAQVTEIATSKVGRVAYVSCNPVTFARDAKTLCEAGFGLEWVDVVDQFRWSTHVELAAKFSR